MSFQIDEDQSTSGDSEKHIISFISGEIDVNWFVNVTFDSFILRDNEDWLLDLVMGSREMSDG